MRHWRLSPNCRRSQPWAPGGQQQPLWRWGWGRQVLFPRPERSSQEWKAGVRKLAKVSQVPLALPNPLFHPQPLETPLIPPSAVFRGSCSTAAGLNLFCSLPNYASAESQVSFVSAGVEQHTGEMRLYYTGLFFFSFSLFFFFSF